MATDLHPDYLAAPPGERWRGGPLAGLIEALTREAVLAPGEVVHRVLPGGAHVRMRVNPDRAYLRELVLYRKEPAPEDASKWEREVRVFLHHFRIEAWGYGLGINNAGYPTALSVEPQDLFTS
jgi:hypothetical protein